MRTMIVILSVLFCLLCYKLWFASGGLLDYWHLKNEVSTQLKINQKLKQQNLKLSAEVEELKRGEDAIEERARTDLGMVKEDEVFYQYVN